MMDSNAKTPQPLDHVPTENEEALKTEMAEWLMANAFMGLTAYSAVSIKQGYLNSIEFGGHMPDPSQPGRMCSVEATLGVASTPAETYEDPEGTRWRCYRHFATMSMPGYRTAPAAVTRLRAQLYAAMAELSARFDARFSGQHMWVQSSTRADRVKAETASKRESMARLVAGAVALECAGMRVGSEKSAMTPAGVEPGTYGVVRAGKEYNAYVTHAKSFVFTRTK